MSDPFNVMQATQVMQVPIYTSFIDESKIARRWIKIMKVFRDTYR